MSTMELLQTKKYTVDFLPCGMLLGRWVVLCSFFCFKQQMALTKELSERENCVAQLALQVESLSAQVSKKQEEIEEIQCHATTNYNALLVSNVLPWHHCCLLLQRRRSTPWKTNAAI